jgi:hypothetical protein
MPPQRTQSSRTELQAALAAAQTARQNAERILSEGRQKVIDLKQEFKNFKEMHEQKMISLSEEYRLLEAKNDERELRKRKLRAGKDEDGEAKVDWPTVGK